MKKATPLFLIMLFLAACVFAQPTISSVSPLVGYPASTVTITGTNFNTSPANNIVYFGATRATVNTASATSLSVTVPTGATYMPVSVNNTASALTGYSQYPFLPTYDNSGCIPGTVNMDGKVDFITGTSPSGVAIGDLDGDGKADLAVANINSNTLSVFRNTSSSGAITAGSFAVKVDFPTGTNPYSVAIGDLDGDGRADMAVTNLLSNTVSVFRNTGSSGAITSGSFAAKVDFTTGSEPWSVAIGDLDGDGKADMAVANFTATSVSVFRNTSSSGAITSGSFAARVNFTTGSGPFSVAIGDLDGDGKADLAVANMSSSTVSVFRNTSISGAITAGSFATRVNFTTGTFPYSVAMGDLDGDGKAEMAVANYSSNSLSVFRNTSSSGAITSGSFAARVDFATGTNPYSVAIGDLDGDSKADLAVANDGSSTVSVFRNTSSSGAITSGSFAAKVDFTTGSNPYLVAIGDLDGDGKADLAAANYGSNSVSVIRNSPLFTPPTISSVSPLVGYPALSVTITGSNFNTTPANNIVYFGATRATVNTASATSLTVTVPTGATYMPVSVNNTASALTGYSQYPFLPTYDNSANIPGNVNFAPHVTFTTQATPQHSAMGDLDGDGKADLVVANYGANTISVYRNTSTSGDISASSFAAAVTFATGIAPAYVSIGDVDGDGKPDLAVTNSFGTSISVYRNTASTGSITSGSFASPIVVASGSEGQKVAIADLNGDGKAELIAVNYSSNNVLIYRNIGTSGSITAGTFAAPVSFATLTNPGFVSVGDADGDGKPDLAVPIAGSNVVQVFRNTITSGAINSGSFATAVNFTCGSGGSSAEFCDVDGDGKQELIVANNISAGTISVLLNTSTAGSIATGSFASPITFAAGSFPVGLSVGDVDGDSKPDIAVANQLGNTVSVFRNTSISGAINPGSFAARVTFTTGTQPNSSAIGDLDGDGKPEIVTTNYGANTMSVFRNSVLVGPPTITGVSPMAANPGAAVTITGTKFSSIPANNIVYFGATRATVTAASNTLLTATLPTGATFKEVTVNNTASALTGYSQYSFLPTFDNSAYIPGTVYVNDKVDFTAGSFPFSVAIGDLDGDGKADMAVVNFSDNTISIYRNTSSSGAITSGSFAAKVDFATGSNPSILAIGDLDGDGKADLAVANYGSNTVSVFRNTSSSGAITSGSFAARVDFPTGLRPYGVAISDLDGDGKADLAVANYNSNTVSVIRNTSSSGAITSGSFAAKVDFTTGSRPYSVAIGDLDGDGKADLAVSNFNSATVSVFHNTSSSGAITSSSFAAKVDFTAVTNPYILAIGDLDGDGKADLVNSGSHTVSVFRNTGSSGAITAGSFAAKVDFANGTSSQPVSVAIGDLNGDGKADLVVANSGSHNVSVFRNTSSSGAITSGSFAPRVNFAVGTFPWSVAIGDLDGDGKADLAVANQSSNSVSVIRNNPLTPITGTATVCESGTTTLANATTGGTWSSASPSIATVVSGSGIVTGISAGTAVISYTTSGATITTTVTVNPLANAGIITGASSVCAGLSITLGNATSGGVWASSAAGIATVGSTGITTGVAAGIAIISYTVTNSCGSISATKTITVNPLPNAGTITGLSSVNAGSTITLSNTTTGGTWSSSNTAIATVGSTGVVTGVSSGTVTISYTVTNSCGSASTAKTVTVNAALATPITGVRVVCQGATTNLANVTAGGTWSTADGAIATVGTTGVVTGVSGGTTTITYAFSGGGNVTATVTVNAAPAMYTGSGFVCTGSQLNLGSVISGCTWTSGNTARATVANITGIVTGGTTLGTVNITYTNAATCRTIAQLTVNTGVALITGVTSPCLGNSITLANATSGGTWSSSNTARATIDVSTGVLTAVGGGTATISYTLSSGCRRTTIVTVGTPPVITGNPSLCLGQQNLLVSSGGTWSSSNAAIAAVAPNGMVTGMGLGNAVITYRSTANTLCFVTQTVTVNPVSSIIAGPTAMCPGETATLSSSPAGGTWTSTYPSKASVDPLTGVVTAVIFNYSTISCVNIIYTLPSGCGRLATVTINPLPSPIGGNSNICVAGTTTLTNSSVGCTWSSASPSIATAAAGGIITGVSAGLATISYTNALGCAHTKVVTVNAMPGGNTGSATLCLPGGSTTLSNPAGAGTWTSSNTTKAIVNFSTGVVTGVNTGTSNITYSKGAGCISVTQVTVSTCSARPGMTEDKEAGNNIFSVSPNPTTGAFNLTTSILGKVEIYTIDGKELQQYDAKEGTTNISLPAGIANGVYLLRFNGADGSSKIVRLVYQQ